MSAGQGERGEAQPSVEIGGPRVCPDKACGATDPAACKYPGWMLCGHVKHRLLGSVCSCGDWSAGCGHDVPEQWRQHVNAAEQSPNLSPGESTPPAPEPES